MRIVAGSARGRKLIAPAGEVTRPTADFVKENMFNIIQFDIEGRDVLDLYCGSGQLGLEALSRGAAKAVLVDMSAAAAEAARKNAETLGFTPRCRVVTAEVLKFLEGRRDKTDLVFLDPPYQTPLADKTLRKLAAFDILRPGGIIVCECAREDEPDPLQPPYRQGKRYNYGSRSVILYTRGLEG
ncbi:MAG: 16S rRNA (guanine(966)-N(2))-methyltransferase RsmD [Oscillospiraceae bacterium]|nr:16S rRNA (guanine(966)-N(2))-methyltransferase RsmD [Oscillospiraceae bacterium]